MSKTKYYIGSDELKLGVWLNSLITDICIVYEYKYTMDDIDLEQTVVSYLSDLMIMGTIRLNTRIYAIEYDVRPIALMRELMEYLEENISLNDWLLEYEVPRPNTDPNQITIDDIIEEGKIEYKN